MTFQNKIGFRYNLFFRLLLGLLVSIGATTVRADIARTMGHTIPTQSSMKAQGTGGIVSRGGAAGHNGAAPAAVKSSAAPQSTVQVAAESALKAGQVFAKHIMQKKEANAVIKNAKQTAANGNAREVPGTELRTALREVEITTGRKITIEQKKQLIDYCLKNKQFEKLSVGEKASHSNNFTPATRQKLIKDWEHMGGTTKVRDWPKYTKDVLGKDGKLIAKSDTQFQAHHIIPQQVKGPHEWWNMHPAATPMHQEILHGSASRLMEILRTLS
ncbi:MAG TPA: hypothetical protein DIC42_00990 [Holosporales bacterium]|nr:hypothetical protein [Holosporales bacterium]